MDLRSLHRQLADRAAEIDVGIHWRFLVLPHQIVKSRRVAVRFNDPRLHHDLHAIRPLAGDLQLLARIAIELVSVPEKTSRCAGGPGSRQVLWSSLPAASSGIACDQVFSGDSSKTQHIEGDDAGMTAQ
jgi:hypothetical protein